MGRSVQERVREAKASAYREAILEGAEAVFAERGFAAARVAEVAEAAGVSLGTLYKVFEGKEAVHRAVHQWRAEEILRWCTPRPEQLEGAPEPVLQALLIGVGGYARFQLAHPNYLRLSLRETPSWASARSMAVPEQVAAWQHGFQLAVEVFRGGIEQGAFVDEPPELHARAMIALLQVHLADGLERDPPEPHEVAVARIQRAVVRAVATERVRVAFEATSPECP